MLNRTLDNLIKIRQQIQKFEDMSSDFMTEMEDMGLCYLDMKDEIDTYFYLEEVICHLAEFHYWFLRMINEVI